MRCLTLMLMTFLTIAISIIITVFYLTAKKTNAILIEFAVSGKVLWIFDRLTTI